MRNARSGITVRPMRFSDVDALSAKLDPLFVEECRLHGLTPTAALLLGLRDGFSWTFCFNNQPRGCFGFSTHFRTVWSLWATLSPLEARVLLKECRPWITYMVRKQGGGLFNVVHETNQRTIRWLKATGCFNFAEKVDGEGWLRFDTKEELNDV